MPFHEDPRSIVNWSMHELITGRKSGSLTDESIRIQTADWVESGIVGWGVGLNLFDAIVKIAEDAFEAGRNSMPHDYRNALWELHRLNDQYLDSLSVHEFIERHKPEVGITELTNNSMMTEDLT